MALLSASLGGRSSVASTTTSCAARRYSAGLPSGSAMQGRNGVACRGTERPAFLQPYSTVANMAPARAGSFIPRDPWGLRTDPRARVQLMNTGTAAPEGTPRAKVLIPPRIA